MSPTYYCHVCAAANRLLYAPPADPLATQYQLGKYMKHTNPDPKYPVQSVFATASTQAYEHYIVSSLAAGAVALDARGTTVIWVAGKDIGFRVEQGQLIAPQDAVKVVLSTDPEKTHGYSVHSSTFTGATCAQCGRWAVVM
jgi:hypothetical protein